MINVELADCLWWQFDIGTLRYVELKHVIFFELNSSLNELPAIYAHVNLVKHGPNYLSASNVGKISDSANWIRRIENYIV